MAVIGVNAIRAMAVWKTNRHNAIGIAHAFVGSSVLASHCHTTITSTAVAACVSGLITEAVASPMMSAKTTLV